MHLPRNVFAHHNNVDCFVELHFPAYLLRVVKRLCRIPSKHATLFGCCGPFWPTGCCSSWVILQDTVAPRSHASKFAQWPFAILKQGDKTIIKEVCWPWAANKSNYDAFYYTFLIHGGFIFVKLSLSWGRLFEYIWCHHNVKSMGRVAPTVTPLHLFSGPHNQDINWKIETFLLMCQADNSHWTE